MLLTSRESANRGAAGLSVKDARAEMGDHLGPRHGKHPTGKLGSIPEPVGGTKAWTPYSGGSIRAQEDREPPKRKAPLSLHPIDLAEKLSRIPDFWHPRIIGELNGQHVKLAKVKGEFIWHHHQNEDELFLVLEGELRLEFRDGAVTLGPGEMYIVPRGVEHRPVAPDEAHILMFEPASTLNTGNVEDERTVKDLQRL